MGNNALIWTFAGVIAAATFARGHAMTNTFHMFLWYALGALVLAGASLIWVSLEPAILVQHRLVVGTVGALFGALALLSVAEWIVPAKSQAPLPPSEQAKPPTEPLPQQPSQSSSGKNSPNISAGRDVIIGHVGDSIARPYDLSKNEGVLIPRQEPIPSYALRCGMPANAFIVIWGTNVSWSTKFPHTILQKWMVIP